VRAECAPLLPDALSGVPRGQPLLVDWNGDLRPDLLLPADLPGTEAAATALLLNDGSGHFSVAPKYASRVHERFDRTLANIYALLRRGRKH